MDILSREIWEREYLDMWSVVHFLTGVCFGFSIFFYNSPFVESFVVFVALIILWEVVEFCIQAGETIPNQVFDVLTGAAGFLVTYKTVPILTPSFTGQMIYFTTAYFLAWLLAHYGFQFFARMSPDRDVEKYKKSFRSAAFLYVFIVVSLFLL